MINENIKFKSVRPNRNDRRRPRRIKLFFPLRRVLFYPVPPYFHITRLVKVNSVRRN